MILAQRDRQIVQQRRDHRNRLIPILKKMIFARVECVDQWRNDGPFYLLSYSEIIIYMKKNEIRVFIPYKNQ